MHLLSLADRLRRAGEASLFCCGIAATAPRAAPDGDVGQDVSSEHVGQNRPLVRVHGENSSKGGVLSQRQFPTTDGSDSLPTATRSRPSSPRAAGFPHKQWTEPLLGLIGVVGGAAQFEIVDGRRPAIGERNSVVVLESGCLATTASGPDEGASIAVASADRASQMRGDMA